MREKEQQDTLLSAHAQFNPAPVRKIATITTKKTCRLTRNAKKMRKGTRSVLAAPTLPRIELPCGAETFESESLE